MALEGKKILVGITGGIAAYKIASFVRLLKKSGAEVRCMMTSASSHFITPLTLSTLSGNEVALEFYDASNGRWTNHVEWALWADAMIIAPATAASIAKMANGISDNFVITTYLSAKCPVFIAPAMDLDMYQHPTTKSNIAKLESFGNRIIPAESGFLASGLEGEGRMAEPETLLKHLTSYFSKDSRFEGKKVLITAGPTYEAIDPVRFIGNHSTGKMGFALAEVLAGKGAEVYLIHGPSNLKANHPAIHVIPVKSAMDMLLAVQTNWEQMDWGIFAAAVADYRPKHVADNKIKKAAETLTIELERNPDILTWAASNRIKQFVVGFALETQDGLNYAQDKLKRKNLDAIVLNELGAPGVGFGTDTNSVKLIYKNNIIRSFELDDKTAIAAKIVNDLIEHTNA